MAKEFHWNLHLQGYILSAFPTGYLTSQLFAHMFVRRFGTKMVLALAVFTWSLVTFATPFLAPMPLFLICSRIALGFGEGLGERCVLIRTLFNLCFFQLCQRFSISSVIMYQWRNDRDRSVILLRWERWDKHWLLW
jgi:MFS family permease